MVSDGDAELMWLVGILEGEGWLGSDRGVRACVQVAMTDEDVVQKAANLMGATAIGRRERADKRRYPKPIYVARVHGYQAARIMQMVLPHMGKRRSEEIRSALQKWEERPLKYRETGLPPECHPDRRHRAKGLCTPCYYRSQYLQRQAVQSGMPAGWST